MHPACPNGQQTTVANGQWRSLGVLSRSKSRRCLPWSQVRRLPVVSWSGAGSNRRPSAFQPGVGNRCWAQPGRTTRLADGGSTASRRAGRMGRRTSSPPQFGQMPCRTFSAQSRHQVHSYVQMSTSGDAGSRSWSQHSQFGRSSSTWPVSAGSGAWSNCRSRCRPPSRLANPANGRDHRTRFGTAGERRPSAGRSITETHR